MTDNEIIKGVVACINTVDTNCGDCPYFKDKSCTQNLTEDFLDLINRQKAEVERLTKGCGIIIEEDENWYPSPLKTPEEIKAEAVKELLKKLTKEYGHYTLDTEICIDAIFCSIKHIVKEMVGEKNE